MSQAMTVEPHRSTMIDSIEMDAELIALHQHFSVFGRDNEVLDIYALTALKVSRRTSHLRIKWQFDTPIMRNGDFTEVFVSVYLGRMRSRYLACSHLSLFWFGIICNLCLFRN